MNKTKPDYDAERDFWKSYISKDVSLKNPESYKQRFPSRLLPFIDAFDGTPHMLELGPGPKSHLGWGVYAGRITVVAIDPLADDYAEIIARAGVDYPIRPIKGFGEHLRDAVGDATFDMAYSSNAIDHSVDPKMCIANMTEMLRVGGVLYLEGFVNEGSEANFTGLHQHDIALEGEHLIHRDNHGKETPLTQDLPLTPVYTEITTFVARFNLANGNAYQNRPYYIAIYRKA